MQRSNETTVQHRSPDMGQSIIDVRGLVKRYGDSIAVDGIDLHVYGGEIFGILGPNGAGKTTTLEMIEGLREPDAGTIKVDGVDVVRHPERVKRRIGIQLQSATLFDHLTVRELVALFASLYGVATTQSRVNELLEVVSLTEKAEARANQLSGGQQQRLSIALALVNDPVIVFLDEPTTGLDPQARRNLWDVVREIRADGKTVVLTTHYMEEAEILCDRVAVMDHGKVILCDTPQRLIDTLDVNAAVSADFGKQAPAIDQLRTIPGATEVEFEHGRVTIHTTNLRQTMAGLIELAGQNGLELGNLSTSRPTLEDVFLHYTGRSLRT